MITISASFRIMHADLVPAEVSELLCLFPSHSHKKGDPHVSSSGQRYSNFSEGLWEIRSSLEPADSLDAHLRGLLAPMVERRKTLKRLRDSGHRMDVFVGVFGEDSNLVFELTPTTLALLGDLGLTCVFDVYCDPDEASDL